MSRKVQVAPAPFGSEDLGAIAEKRESLKQFEAKLNSLAETVPRRRGAPKAGYGYLGCAKTFTLRGKAFAEANLKIMRDQYTE